MSRRRGCPKYEGIVIRKVDENLNPEFSDKFDYYYIPCMFVDGKTQSVSL